ncbi:unnamed protein product [Coccothraustes coccothraustes]
MGFWLPRVAWLKSGCRSWGKRNRGGRGEGAAPGLGPVGRGRGDGKRRAYRWTAANRFVGRSRQRAAPRSLPARERAAAARTRLVPRESRTPDPGPGCQIAQSELLSERSPRFVQLPHDKHFIAANAKTSPLPALLYPVQSGSLGDPRVMKQGGGSVMGPAVPWEV